MAKPASGATLDTGSALYANLANAWPLLENTGTTSADLKSSNTATFHGSGIAWASDAEGPYVNGTDGNSWMDLASDVTIPANTSFSIAWGTKGMTSGANTNMVFGNAAGTDNYWWEHLSAGMAFNTPLTGSGGVLGVTTIDNRVDHVISFAYSGGNYTVNFWDGGTLGGDSPQTIAAGASPNTINALMQGFNASNFAMIGQFYYCYIWIGRALNGTEAASLAGNPYQILTSGGGGATAYTLTAPVTSKGDVTTASDNFTITPNGTYTGTITITPSGGGLSTPIVKTFSGSATPQTFTITPTLIGTVTLSGTNSGGLANPSSVTYLSMIQLGSSGTAPSGNATPALGGFNFFLATAWWQEFGRDISADAADPHSAAIMANFTGSPNVYAYPMSSGNALYGMPINIVPGTQATKTVTAHTYFAESDVNQTTHRASVPIPAAPSIQGWYDAGGAFPTASGQVGDARMIVGVRNETTGELDYLWELYTVWTTDGGATWEAEAVAYFDLTTHRPRLLGNLSSDAAGLPVLPLLIKYEEVASGTISHALRTTFSNYMMMSRCTWPGRHLTSEMGSALTLIAYGGRVRLNDAWYQANKASYTGQARPILDAMAKYGMINSDGSGFGLGHGIDIEGPADDRWNLSDLAQLANVPMTAFEVLTQNADYTFTGPPSGVVGSPYTFTVTKYPANSGTAAGDQNFDENVYVFLDGVNTWTVPLADATPSGTFDFTPSTPGTYTLAPALGSPVGINAPALSFTATGTPHAYTSQRNGDWNVPSGTASSPWYDGGTQSGWNSVPSSINSDTVTITHDVTATADISIGDGTASTVLTCATGTLAITGCTLTIRGNSAFGVSNGGVVVGRLSIFSSGGASASLLLDGNSGVSPTIACASDTLLTFTGTASRRVAVRTKNGTTGDPGYITASAARTIYTNFAYVDFSHLGGASQAGLVAPHVGDTGTGNPPFLWDHCTIDNCGQFPSCGSDGQTVNFQLTYCKWTNPTDASGYPFSINISDVPTTGTRLIRSCVTPEGEGQANFGSTRNVTFDNCFFGSMVFAQNSVPPWTVMQDCFLYQSTNYGGADTTETNGDITNCFCLIGTAGGLASFTLCCCDAAGATWSGNVFQSARTSGDRDAFLVGTGEEGDTTHLIAMRHNLVIPTFGGDLSGYLIANYNNSSQGWVTNCVVEHNTQFIGPSSAVGPDSAVPACCALMVKSGGTGMRADEISSFKSNLIVRTGAAPGGGTTVGVSPVVAKYADGPVLDALAAANCDYNGYTALDPVPAGWWTGGGSGNNIAGAGGEVGRVYDTPMSGTPGAHDVHLGTVASLSAGGPQFVDPTRGLLQFDAYMGGDGSLGHALAALKAGTLGDTADPNYIAGYTTAALVSWIKAGWAPTNPALHNTAHDGTDIGAVAYQASAATTYTLTPPSPAAGRPGVASADFTIQCDGIPSAPVTITPSDGGNGGSFAPASLTISDAAAHTFKYTAATIGNKFISCTNDGGLADPVNVSYHVYTLALLPAAQAVAVNTAATLTATLTGGTPSGLAATTDGGTLSTATPTSGVPFTLTTQASGSGMDTVTVTGPGGNSQQARIYYPRSPALILFEILGIYDSPARRCR